MNMVERVARAMQSVDDSMNNRMELTDAEAVQLARAAIEAMREPTCEMEEAGRANNFGRYANAGYEAMIDAALNEQSS